MIFTTIFKWAHSGCIYYDSAPDITVRIAVADIALSSSALGNGTEAANTQLGNERNRPVAQRQNCDPPSPERGKMVSMELGLQTCMSTY